MSQSFPKATIWRISIAGLAIKTPLKMAKLSYFLIECDKGYHDALNEQGLRAVFSFRWPLVTETFVLGH
jgi:hypothetical protein